MSRAIRNHAADREAAKILGISARTTDNYWAHARDWLSHRLNGQKG